MCDESFVFISELTMVWCFVLFSRSLAKFAAELIWGSTASRTARSADTAHVVAGFASVRKNIHEVMLLIFLVTVQFKINFGHASSDRKGCMHGPAARCFEDRPMG